jgi:hypothetical protein
MITARHNRYITGFFRIYVQRILRRHFHAIRVLGDVPDGNRSVLLIGNHFSWWDGFIAFYLNNNVLHKRFHVMMLEEQLSRRRFFRGMGAFSVQPGNRSMLESLRYASNVLCDDENLLLMYPQGKIETSYIQYIRFGKGVMNVIEGVPGHGPAILFYVALTDYFSNRKPSLNLYLQPYAAPSTLTLQQLEAQYNNFYRGCIQLQEAER